MDSSIELNVIPNLDIVIYAELEEAKRTNNIKAWYEKYLRLLIIIVMEKERVPDKKRYVVIECLKNNYESDYKETDYMELVLREGPMIYACLFIFWYSHVLKKGKFKIDVESEIGQTFLAEVFYGKWKSDDFRTDLKEDLHTAYIMMLDRIEVNVAGLSNDVLFNIQKVILDINNYNALWAGIRCGFFPKGRSADILDYAMIRKLYQWVPYLIRQNNGGRDYV